MTDREFKKSVKGKSLEDFTRCELLKACEFDKYPLSEVRMIATDKNWNDVVTHAGTFESEKPKTGWYRPAPTVK